MLIIVHHHTDNSENNFLVLAEGDTLDIHGSFGTPEKKFSINFRKTKKKLLPVFTLQS